MVSDVHMQTASISFRHSQVHYSFDGNGPRLLLCFHGYGESEESFRFLENYLHDDYRVVAIDLPFHGNTQWKDGLVFTSSDLQQLMQSILSQLGYDDSRYTLMGFSMGGRMALSLLQSAPERVERLILLAPDGLKVNRWYWLATQTWLGNQLFRFTMKHPRWFFVVLKIGNRMGLINQSIYKFTGYYINDEAIRMELYHRWTCMRKIRPDLPTIQSLVRQYQIPVKLLYGGFDRIILPKRGEKFRQGIEEYCTLEVIPAGHKVLQEKNVEAILALF